MNDIERARKNRELKKLMEDKPLTSRYLHLPGSPNGPWLGPAQANFFSLVHGPLLDAFYGSRIVDANGRPVRSDEP